MRLRNKRTGQEGNFIINKDHFECTDLEYVPEYRSLAELNEEWEDYKPKAPLIKDEKIRKAVRAWAGANNTEKVAIQNSYCLSAEGDEYETIIFASPVFKDIDDDDFRTIAELCGEEEE